MQSKKGLVVMVLCLALCSFSAPIDTQKTKVKEHPQASKVKSDVFYPSLKSHKAWGSLPTYFYPQRGVKLPTTGGLKCVVIDAGHGGHDAGCGYGGIKEKNVTLKIAKQVGAYITDNLPGVKVVYTRTTDTFVELWERAAIANKAKADLFISVHCNANNNTKVFGTESYIMGIHKTEDNLEVAKRENAVILLENGTENRYDGYDPNSEDAHIVFTLYQEAYLDQSLRLAGAIEKDFSTKAKRSSRGVKQAGFVVLWKTAMPSVLVETGFLSNATERSYLNSASGQDLIASGIYRSVKALKAQREATKTSE